MLQSLSPMAAMLLAELDWGTLGFLFMWLCVVILAVIMEAMTAELVAIWFAPGAFVSMILAFFEVSLTVQLIVFVSLTAVSLVLAKLFLRKVLKKHHRVEKTNADALAGQLALVEETIDNAKPSGVAKINGQLWTARMEDPAVTVPAGEWVEIVRVSGAKLICRPKS